MFDNLNKSKIRGRFRIALAIKLLECEITFTEGGYIHPTEEALFFLKDYAIQNYQYEEGIISKKFIDIVDILIEEFISMIDLKDDDRHEIKTYLNN